MRIPFSFCVFCSEIPFSATYLNVIFQNVHGWMICVRKPQLVWVKFNCTSWNRVSNLIVSFPNVGRHSVSRCVFHTGNPVVLPAYNDQDHEVPNLLCYVWRTASFYCGAAIFSDRLRLSRITNVAYQIKYACICHFIHQ